MRLGCLVYLRTGLSSERGSWMALRVLRFDEVWFQVAIAPSRVAKILPLVVVTWRACEVAALSIIPGTSQSSIERTPSIEQTVDA